MITVTAFVEVWTTGGHRFAGTVLESTIGVLRIRQETTTITGSVIDSRDITIHKSQIVAHSVRDES